MPLGLHGNNAFSTTRPFLPQQPLASPLALLRTSLARPHDPSYSVKMPGIVSATGVLAFLTDEEPELKVFALQTLNDDIDTVWTEVAAVLTQMYVIFASRLSWYDKLR